MVDTTPQDQDDALVRVLNRGWDELDYVRASERDVNGPLPCGCFRVEVLDFGHRQTCTKSAAQVQDADEGGPERSDPQRLIEAVERRIRQDFRLRIGPNTRQLIVDGQESIQLSGSEAHCVAHAAAEAVQALLEER